MKEQLDPSIISNSRDCYVPSNRERRRAYADRLERWLENGFAQAEVVVNAASQAELFEPAANNISRFLRKGGAK